MLYFTVNKCNSILFDFSLMKTIALTTYEASLQCKDTEHIATLRGSVVNTCNSLGGTIRENTH